MSSVAWDCIHLCRLDSAPVAPSRAMSAPSLLACTTQPSLSLLSTIHNPLFPVFSLPCINLCAQCNHCRYWAKVFFKCWDKQVICQNVWFPNLILLSSYTMGGILWWWLLWVLTGPPPVLNPQMNGSYFRVWETPRKSRDCAKTWKNWRFVFAWTEFGALGRFRLIRF